MPDTSPPPLAWSIRVGMEAARFFGTDQELRRTVQAEQGIAAPEGSFVPFSVMQFNRYLDERHIESTGRRANDIEAMLGRMASAGILFDAGIDPHGLLMARRYVLGASLTAQQRRGVLWLAPIIGPELVISVMEPSLAHITGVDSKGDVHSGSGLLIDSQHVITAAHVVTDMTLDDVVHFSGEYEATVDDVLLCDEQRDVAVVRVTLPRAVERTVVGGLTFRDPEWADQVMVMGFPPVPTTLAAHLTVQTGEVVNPSVGTTANGEWFLYSAVARPGNSGGPIVAADGRVLGLVTREFSDEAKKAGSPFFAGIPTSSIADAFEEGSLSGLLPIEQWT